MMPLDEALTEESLAALRILKAPLRDERIEARPSHEASAH